MPSLPQGWEWSGEIAFTAMWCGTWSELWVSLTPDFTLRTEAVDPFPEPEEADSEGRLFTEAETPYPVLAGLFELMREFQKDQARDKEPEKYSWETKVSGGGNVTLNANRRAVGVIAPTKNYYTVVSSLLGIAKKFPTFQEALDYLKAETISQFPEGFE